jgi:hypothetical protein
LHGCRLPDGSAAPTPDPALDLCTVDNDCLLAIRVDRCCPCPELATRAQVEADEGLEVYIEGVNYAPFLPEACSEAVCGPCQPLPAAVACQDGRCRPVP